MALKRKPRRGSEMYRLGQSLQKKLRKSQKQLTEAEWLIRELCGHEGAEGWSGYLATALERYEFQTPAHKPGEGRIKYGKPVGWS